MGKSTVFLAVIATIAAVLPATAAQRKPVRPPPDKFAKIRTIAILPSLPGKMVFRDALHQVDAFKGCEDITDISDLDLNDIIATEAKRLLESRFTVVQVPFDPSGFYEMGFLGQLSRKALPKAENVDAFMVVFGNAEITHPPDEKDIVYQGAAGYLTSAYVSSLAGKLENVEANITIDVIEAKSQKTILRIRPEMMLEFKQRIVPDHLCSGKPASEKKATYKNDFEGVVRRKLEKTFPVNSLGRLPSTAPTAAGQ